MDTAGENNQHIGQALYDTGWRQGAIFTLPSASFTHLTVATDSAEASIPGKADVARRPVRPKERLVLITQDCDMVASDSEEPYVEALICAIEKPTRATKIDRNSARYFLVDPATGLVARAKHRIAIEKRALLSVAYSPWPSSTERFERFVRWLVRRYDRPAIPDALHDALRRPVETALDTIDREMPDIGAAFSRAVHEVRVNMPEHETPPYNLQLIFLIKKDAITNEETDALFAVWDAIQSQIDPGLVTLDPELRLVTAEDISLAEYRVTRPLFLEYLTYRGEEIEGEPPFPRS